MELNRQKDQKDALEQVTEQQRGNFEWVGVLINNLIGRITLNDASLISIPILNNLNGHANELRSRIQAFAGDGNLSQLDRIGNTLDEALITATSLLSTLGKSSGPVTRTVNRVISHIEELNQVAEGKANEFDKRLASYDERITETSL